MDKFEYEISSGVDVFDLTNRLYNRGQDGWELVSVVYNPGDFQNKACYDLFFKRKLSVEQ